MNEKGSNELMGDKGQGPFPEYTDWRIDGKKYQTNDKRETDPISKWRFPGEIDGEMDRNQPTFFGFFLPAFFYVRNIVLVSKLLPLNSSFSPNMFFIRPFF